MKYWCPECKREYNTDFNMRWCPLCDASVEFKGLVKLPDFETPEQYEKRTGKKWNGAVWFRKKEAGEGGINENGDYVSSSNNWDISTIEHLDFLYLTKNKDGEPFENLTILCANSPELPPDDYVPEVEA